MRGVWYGPPQGHGSSQPSQRRGAPSLVVAPSSSYWFQLCVSPRSHSVKTCSFEAPKSETRPPHGQPAELLRGMTSGGMKSSWGTCPGALDPINTNHWARIPALPPRASSRPAASTGRRNPSPAAAARRCSFHSASTPAPALSPGRRSLINLVHSHTAQRLHNKNCHLKATDGHQRGC